MSKGVAQKGMKKMEYTAIKYLVEVAELFKNDVAPELQERVKLIEGGEQLLKDALANMIALEEGLVDTVPLNRRKEMRIELEHTYIDVYTKYSPKPVPENYMVIKDDTLIKLMQMAQAQECDMCSKCGREVDRCPIRSTFDGCLMYQHGKNEDGTCPYQEFKI